MGKTQMAHMIDYFEAEYKDVERVIIQKVWWVKPREIIDKALQRMFGVAMYAQRLDDKISFIEVAEIYTSYKEKLENLLTD